MGLKDIQKRFGQLVSRFAQCNSWRALRGKMAKVEHAVLSVLYNFIYPLNASYAEKKRPGLPDFSSEWSWMTLWSLLNPRYREKSSWRIGEDGSRFKMESDLDRQRPVYWWRRPWQECGEVLPIKVISVHHVEKIADMKYARDQDLLKVLAERNCLVLDLESRFSENLGFQTAVVDLCWMEWTACCRQVKMTLYTQSGGTQATSWFYMEMRSVLCGSTTVLTRSLSTLGRTKWGWEYCWKWRKLRLLLVQYLLEMVICSTPQWLKRSTFKVVSHVYEIQKGGSDWCYGFAYGLSLRRKHGGLLSLPTFRVD